VKDESVNARRISKSNLGFRRMNIGVHLTAGKVEKEIRDRLIPRNVKSLVGAPQCVGEGSISDPPSIDEEVLLLRIATVHSWRTDVSNERGKLRVVALTHLE
tara:strand:- start:94 stop:399 length:306 start_codon:yes stop_codon:yes gene_type:complete